MRICLASEPLALSSNLRRSGRCIQFLKGPDRRYIRANQGMAVFFGVESTHDVVGRKTDDFFDDGIVERYDTLDGAVSAGDTLIDRFDFTYDHTGHARWYLYARSMAFRDGRSVVRGISFPLPERAGLARAYQRLHVATELMANDLPQPVSIEAVAGAARCSVAQLERHFLMVLGQSPKQYRARLRVQCGLDRIRQGRTLTEAALDAGYSEHSAFSRAVKSVTGLTPSEFRATLSTH